VTKKERLDCLVFERGFAESREKARALIMEGSVYVNGQMADKPGTQVTYGDKIELRGKKLRYVSRGGLKLEKAVDVFSIDLNGMAAMDIGASTGGFTDCMLQNGASKVYSVDVGYGQLAWKLRTDKRVVNLERTNVRYLGRAQVPENVDFFSIDVAFISLKLVLPVAYEFSKENARGVCLIKPQFEAGKNKVGKNGVVRDKNVHAQVISDILAFTLGHGFSVLGLTYSPVKGPKGNIEYLMYIQKSGNPVNCAADVKETVEQSHEELNGGDHVESSSHS